MAPRIFEQQVISARDKMFRFAFGMLNNAEDARDVVQDALVKIWNQREKLGAVEHPEAWCMQVVRNLCLDQFKARKTRMAAAKVLAYRTEAPLMTPYQEMEKKDLLERVRKIICELPEKPRMILHLRDVEGFTYKEIAEIMELSMEEVKIGLFRARKVIKERLTKHKVYGLP